MSFGEEFGKLVKRRRGVEGLTQQALAVLAFGDESFKTRISELENGKVSNPQPKTIDALVVALNISDDELNQIFNRHPHPRIFDSLMDFFKIDSNLSMDIDIKADELGRATLFHNRPLSVELTRLEYFRDEMMLVLLEASGRRRPAGIALTEKLDRYIRKARAVQFVYVDQQKRKQRVGSTYKLKIID